MTALPADISRATRPAKVVTRTDDALHQLFPGARDGLSDPDPGFFENSEDALAVLAFKAALIGRINRRFVVNVAAEMDVDPLVTIPSFQLSDDQLKADLPVMLARLELDMESETTALEVVG